MIEGGFCPGGTNGEQTPILSEMNFWRSSANATQLYRCCHVCDMFGRADVTQANSA